MKILLIACADASGGGIGRVSFSEANLLSQNPEIQNVTLATMGGTGVEQVNDKFKIARCRALWQVGFAGAILSLRKMIQEHDIVHLHYPFFGTNELAAFYAWFYKKPFVVTYHMDAKDRGFKFLFYAAYQKLWLPIFLKSVDKLICASFDYLETSAAGNFFKKNKEKCVEIPFGVDINFFSPHDVPRSFKERFGIALDAKIILSVAALDRAHYFKGIPVLLKAFSKWERRKKEKWELVVVGEGSLKPVYEGLGRDLGIASSVHFIGRVPDSDLADFYRISEVFALSSIDKSEAFGLVLEEALSTGIPVVASDLSGVRTLVKNTDGGALVAPCSPDALCRGFDEVIRRKVKEPQWQDSIRERIKQQYANDTHIENLVGVYKNLQSQLRTTKGLYI